MGYHPPATTENFEQRELFEKYCVMGRGRTLRKLLTQTKRPWGTVQTWSRKFGWVRRAADRDHESLGSVGLETPENNLKNKKLALDIVNKMIQDMAILDEDGKVVDTVIKAKNVFDLRTLVDVRDEILGLKEKAEKNKLATTNIDKAIFIIKK
jgi:hypothetical protein